METQPTTSKSLIGRLRGFVWRWTGRFLLLCLGIIILGVLLFGWEYYLASQKEVIEFDRQSTWIDGPMRDDGFPDYVAAMETRLANGVDPKQNCVVALAKLIGPDFVTGDESDSYYEKLGVSKPVDDGNLYCDWHDYFGRSGKPGISKIEVDLAVRDRLMQAPWDPEDHPEVFNWIKKNESVMDKIEDCANATQYYHPFVFMNEKKSVRTVLLHAAQELRDINIFLACRGQLAIHQKQFDKAAQCSELILKLSSLLDNSPFFVTGFIACYGRKSAFEIESKLATKVKWSPNKIRKRISLLSRFQPAPMYVERVNWGDRTMALDELRVGLQDGFLLAPSPFGRPDDRSIKKDYFAWFSKIELYKWVNRHIDTVIDYTDPHDDANYDRTRRIKGERFLHFLGNHSKYEWVFYFLSGRKNRSRYLAEFIVASRISKTEFHVDTESKRFMYHRLGQIAWHLNLFKQKHESLPETLQHLKMEYPDLDCADMFSYKQPFAYKNQTERVQVYSRGPNWRDNTHPNREDYQFLSDRDVERYRKNSDDILLVFPK